MYVTNEERPIANDGAPPVSALRIDIAIPAARAMAWHARLRDALAHAFPDARVTLRPGGGAAWPASVRLLLDLERLLKRRMRATLSDALDAAPAQSDAGCDLLIDLCGGDACTAARTLRPLYDGAPCELAAIAALLDGAAPLIEIEDVATGEIVAQGLPSLEGGGGLSGGLDAVFSRVIVLLRRVLVSPPETFDKTPARHRAALSPASFALCTLAARCSRALYRLCCHEPHWRVGWRFNDGPGVFETASLDGPQWRALDDRALGFAADPFPCVWRGRSGIFYEGFDYAADKGAIYFRKFDDRGPVSEPLLALAEPWHLSYPHLIEHEGELYMLPEASQSNAITLYRCVEFPHRWERAATLVDRIEAGDATIFRHGGQYWMASVVREGAGGYSDTLALHHAPHLFGPWREHTQKPVRVDARYARPAGAVIARDGALWRPVQDCRVSYGAGIAYMRIDELDVTSFRETPAIHVTHGRCWPGARLHTINRWERLECIDGVIPAPKNVTLRGLTNRVIDAKARRSANE